MDGRRWSGGRWRNLIEFKPKPESVDLHDSAPALHRDLKARVVSLRSQIVRLVLVLGDAVVWEWKRNKKYFASTSRWSLPSLP